MVRVEKKAAQIRPIEIHAIAVTSVLKAIMRERGENGPNPQSHLKKSAPPEFPQLNQVNAAPTTNAKAMEPKVLAKASGRKNGMTPNKKVNPAAI